MEALERLLWISAWTQVAFVLAFGAIVGSFLNVVAYRLPMGRNLIVPPSACPYCETRLRWADNIPILGWLLLGGRCRYCKSRISPQYPLVELFVALLFAGTYALWFAEPSPWSLAGLDPDWWRPGWADVGIGRSWPMFALVLLLFAGLVAITLIDAKTFTIPLIIPWIVTGAAFAVHPVYAVRGAGWHDPEARWALWLAQGPTLGLALGGMAGLGLALLLLRTGVMPRSYADYDAWEREVEEKLGRPASVSDEPAYSLPSGRDKPALRALLTFGPALAFMWIGLLAGDRFGRAPEGMLAGIGVGLIMGMVLRRLTPRGVVRPADEPIWLQYPHTRREMFKELLFLSPIVVVALVGSALTAPGGALDATGAPLWLEALGGAALGYLVGGAVVWSIRVMGSLAFGKEAMGLGDVHLMGMVGAVMGWADAFLAFFLAPFLAIAWTVGALLLSRGGSDRGTALPFGPHLAAATVLVIVGKPVVEAGLGALMGHAIDLP
jgi:leader peptidase (prepilin peptidase)/N-methyltransferase